MSLNRWIRRRPAFAARLARSVATRWNMVVGLGVVALLLSAPVYANKVTERSKQKRAAEKERAALLQKLDALKRDIGQTETARSHAADELAQTEKTISEANRALHDLAAEQQQTTARLTQLAQQQSRLADTVATQQRQLAKLLREQYVAGNEDRMKLLLSGDNPNRINRELQYMGYVSQAQARLIASLRTNLETIESNRLEVQNARDELDEIEQEQRASKAQLEQEKTKRSALLAQLSNKLSAQRRQVGNYERDEQRLGGLVDRLSHLIEEQRKADAAAREKQERQEQLARAKAQSQAERTARETAAKEAGSKAKSKIAGTNPDAIDNDEAPTKRTARQESAAVELAPVAGIQDTGSGRAFSALRGQLRLPVRGELSARFGSRRADGPSWKGLFIRAAEGAEVKAVAAGRVVFAEWLRGFGNLIIVDHGSQYMTIYGNNQAVLKQAGDVVKMGDVIANAGNSGGNEQSGLYFEMRHQGRAFDPLGWMAGATGK